ncbi:MULTISPECIES: hypothetical protein [Bacteria]|uniref:hypothetical protein n=1 Tax=Bacteria TaxID=2 RepID=UPI001040334C|nr:MULTISPECIES: hypothetical protein [Bacteria]QDM40968.1 hypothetical protein C0V74_07945 [Altererythrobacter sp. TH136]TCJ39951.1 hypothetical protein E0504_08540 [Parafrankia sp. BMG5.11]
MSGAKDKAGKLDRRDRIGPALTVAAVVLGAFPTAGLAVTAITAPRDDTIAAAPFIPPNGDSVIARQVAARIAARSQQFRLTPAGSAADQTVTVAIRLDPDKARAVSVRTAAAAVKGEVGAGPSPLSTLAPTRYNLGMSRGYQTFAKPAKTSTADLGLNQIAMPDLASFRPRGGVAEAPGRLQPHIALESDSRTGRSPRTLEGAGEQVVDLGAGYRVSRNLNLTAGVRLSQERDRVAPLTDAVRDDQAVYVGTKFRF